MAAKKAATAKKAPPKPKKVVAKKAAAPPKLAKKAPAKAKAKAKVVKAAPKAAPKTAAAKKAAAAAVAAGAASPKQAAQKATGRKKATALTAAAASTVALSQADLDKAGEALSGAKLLDHVKLVLVDPAANSDKYFVAQVVRAATGHFLITRWGRTGTDGQAQLSEPCSLAAAQAALATKFKEKTGNALEARAAGAFAPKPGKYALLVNSVTPVSGRGPGGRMLWQYYVDDGVDGKPTGWYDYFESAALLVEGVHAEWSTNPSLNVRCVQSGHFAYRVDFNRMTQTNVTHAARKQRLIRRNA